MKIRPAVTIFEEDVTLTLLKPFSEEHKSQLIVIHEDAYCEVISSLVPIKELKYRLNITDEEFDEIILQLR